MDSQDLDKLEGAKTELKNLLDKPQLAGIPILVLGNKNDLPGALTVEQVIDRLYVQLRSDAIAHGRPWQNGTRRSLSDPRPRPPPCMRARALCHSELKSISNREVCCYSISAKNSVNIDITLQWLTKHAKSNNK